MCEYISDFCFVIKKKKITECCLIKYKPKMYFGKIIVQERMLTGIIKYVKFHKQKA